MLQEKLNPAVVFCFLLLPMFSNMHTSINAFLGKSSTALQLHFEEQLIS